MVTKEQHEIKMKQFGIRIARYNKSLLSLLRRLSTGRYLHLLLSAGACSTAPAAVSRYLLPAGRSAANPPATVAAVDRWDRQTDGQTPDRYIDSVPHNVWVYRQ